MPTARGFPTDRNLAPQGSRDCRKLLAAAIVALLWAAQAPAGEPTPEEAEFFERQVRPILAARCHKCHGPNEQKGGLRLDQRESALKGGESGPAIVPGKLDEGFFIDAINYGDVFQMPKDGKLPPDEIAVLTRWIRMGAPWPSDRSPASRAGPASDFNLRERARFWSFQPLTNPPPPPVRQADWPRTDVDRFLLAKLEMAGLAPAADAPRHALLRRLYFDLVGLPPASQEVHEFLSDSSPRAVEALVDRLLASPHFGERWARHWLDLVRYADSRGHEFDYDAPNAWHYRDYVIRAFNADVPYDQLVREHLAGDLLDPPRRNEAEGFNESILATGFWFLGEWVHSPVDIRKDELDRFDNMLDVMSKTFLGLTVACARCHDHKFDAISQRDYYALLGFLQSADYRQVRFDTLESERQVARQLAELAQRERPRIVQMLVEQRRAVVENLADWLLAAAQVMQIAGVQDVLKNTPGGNAGDKNAALLAAEPLPGPVRRAVADVAQGARLDEKLLRRWVAYLAHCRHDRHDPFHAFAALAADSGGVPWDERIAGLADQASQQAAQIDGALRELSMIADYARGDAPSFHDGYTFGSGPIRSGQVLLGDGAASPLVDVARHGAVRRDVAFAGLQLAAGAALDPTRAGTLVRAGRSFKTPTFTITTGKVLYLVSGPGHAYCVVDSHRLNHGPLHGELLRSWTATDAGPQWVVHDMPLHAGHRAHVEFTPEGDNDLAVYMVAQGDRQPSTNPLERPNARVLNLLKSHPAPDLAALARGYHQLLADAAARLRSGERTALADAADADLAHWLVQHRDLLCLDPAAAHEQETRAAHDYLAQRKKLLEALPRISRTAMAMWEGSPENELLLVRGNPRTPSGEVPRRFLEALAGASPLAASGSGRLELARQMTDPALNPFIARVIVNRVWHHLFGRGIVASVDNFGVLGERPTHPELLDYLASRFVADGWSIKRLIRLLVLSHTYQMSSAGDARADELDPENLLLHKMRVRRLQGEVLRDGILAVSGRLDRTLYGPSVPVHLTPFMQGRGRPGQSGPLDGGGRRSIYIAVRRNFLSPMMLAFDTPIPFTTIGRRNVSNVPAQALILMNDPLIVQQAQAWAQRELAPPAATPQERIGRMYLAALARPASNAELENALAFLKEQAAALGLPDQAWQNDTRVWTDLAHVLFNVKEFAFLE